MNTKYEILTEDGFKPFSKINEKVVKSYYMLKCKNVITLEEFELKVTGNHKIKVGNAFKKAAYIKVGTMLSDICLFLLRFLLPQISQYSLCIQRR